QLPINAAYALNAQEAQGQRFPRVRVNVTQAWEAGHAYTALSRATCLSGLEIVPFGRSKVILLDDCQSAWLNNFSRLLPTRRY
ncbi:hypothetical protein DACRYDRAFT_51512, partial [Dacryopinax primogenitus]